MKSKILVYGCFGYYNNQLDGQTIKTRSIYEMLKEKTGNCVRYADSLELNHDKSLILGFFKNLLWCNYLIFIGAGNSLKYVFPPVFILSKIFRFKIIDIVVGGWLNKKLKKWPIHRYMFRHIAGILTQNTILAKELSDECNITFAERMVNFRPIIVPTPHIHTNGKLKLVFMARVNKLKGLDSIENLAKHIKKNFNNQISIDLFGQIHEPDKEYLFSELVDRYSFVQYKGYLEPDTIVSTLHEYDAMLLPTHYYTEGFPGSILDAYRAGIPVIVTKWKYAEEFVIDGKSGFIIPFEQCEEDLCNRVNTLFYDTSLLESMKTYAYQESLKYTPEKAWEIISKYLK